MGKITNKQRFGSIFTRIWLVILFLLNFGVFAGTFVITLFPNSNVAEFDKNFQTFSMWDSNNHITNWGIIILAAIAAITSLNILSIIIVKNLSFKIGKKNKVLKYYLPMTISTIILMIISLINKFDLLTFNDYGSLLYKVKASDFISTFRDNYNAFNANNGPFTIAWFVVFGIFILAALGYVIDFIFFMFRILFSRTRANK